MCVRCEGVHLCESNCEVNESLSVLYIILIIIIV